MFDPTSHPISDHDHVLGDEKRILASLPDLVGVRSGAPGQLELESALALPARLEYFLPVFFVHSQIVYDC
jgi:hypothetical protein